MTLQAVEEPRTYDDPDNPIKSIMKFKGNGMLIDVADFNAVDLKCNNIGGKFTWECKIRDGKSRGVLKLYVDDPEIQLEREPAFKLSDDQVIEGRELSCTWYSDAKKSSEYYSFARGKLHMFCSDEKDRVLDRAEQAISSPNYSQDLINERELEKSRRYVYPPYNW